MNRTVATLLLLLTTFFWGVTFTAVKEAVARVDVFVFLGQRFIASFLLLAALALARGGRPDAATLRRGGVLGCVLFLGYLLQTVALRHTSASNTAFLTGLNVVLVPLIGALAFRQRVPRPLWHATGLALCGLVLLTVNGDWTVNAGDALAALCAVCIAVHLLLTGRFAASSDLWWLTAAQIGVVALLSAAGAAGTGGGLLVWHPALLWPLTVCVLLATVFAFLVQTSAQRVLSPTNAALILCMEPVFGAIWAYGALGERLGPTGLLGAVLILAAMVAAELPGCGPRRRCPRAF